MSIDGACTYSLSYPYTHMSRRTEPRVGREGKWAGFWECFLCCDMVMWNSEGFEKFKSIPSFAGSYKEGDRTHFT